MKSEREVVIEEMREVAKECRIEDRSVGLFADHEQADLLEEWADRLSADAGPGVAVPDELPAEMRSEPGIWGFQSQIENRTLWVGTSDRGEVLIKATNPNNAQPVQKIAFTKEGGEHLLMLLHCALGWPAPAVSASVVTEAKLKEWAWELERDQQRGHLCDVQRRAAGVAQSIRAALERAS